VGKQAAHVRPDVSLIFVRSNMIFKEIYMYNVSVKLSSLMVTGNQALLRHLFPSITAGLI
jgi:hypothetical protein